MDVLDANDFWWFWQELDEQWQHEQATANAAHHLWQEERDMRTSQMVQSKFLKKEDFPEPAVLTIKGVTLEEVGRGDERWVLHFNEKTKGIVLNVTKIRQLEAGYGDDTDLWVGRKVKVSHDPTVMMGQQVVGGIKFTLPSNLPKTAPKAEPEPVKDFDDDLDSVPF